MLKKRVSLMERLDGQSQEDYDAHWAGPHVPIVNALPGLQIYVQHHLVGDQVTAAPPIHGISEVLFDAPEEQPTNTHFSPVQEKDELEFVSSVTAMPMLEAVHRFAPFSVWLVTQEVPDVTGLPGYVLVDTRDLSKPVMTRAVLRTEADPPKAMVSLGFDSLEEAQKAHAALSENLEPGHRIVLTESVRVH